MSIGISLFSDISHGFETSSVLLNCACSTSTSDPTCGTSTFTFIWQRSTTVIMLKFLFQCSNMPKQHYNLALYCKFSTHRMSLLDQDFCPKYQTPTNHIRKICKILKTIQVCIDCRTYRT